MVQAGGVTLYLRLEFQPFPLGKNGHAMGRNRATDQDLVPFPDPVHGDSGFGVGVSDSGGIDKNLISLAAFHHLGIPGYYLYTCFLRSSFHRFHDPQELVHFQAFLNDKAGRSQCRLPPTHRYPLPGKRWGKLQNCP